MSPKEPEWFLLIQKWLGRGRYGLTLPFLVGATAYGRHRSEAGPNDIRMLLREIIEEPVPGYVVHIRWCAEYGSAVFAVYEQNSLQRLHDHVVELVPTGAKVPTVVIERNLAAVWHIPADKDALLDKLIETATKPVITGNFSRNWTEDGVQYQPLQPDDKVFIAEALGVKTAAPR